MDRGNGKPGAIIIGGDFPGLGAARSLAKHGISVYVVDSSVCAARFSRHVRRFFKCPPRNDETAFVGFLLRLPDKADLNGCVLFPTDDECVRILAQHRRRLSERYVVTTPPWDEVRFAYDKRLTHLLALKQGVPIPRTCNPSSAEELASLDFDFPVVLKPAISMHLRSVTGKKAYRANDRQELVDRYRVMAEIVEPSEILIQELIPGRGKNLFSYVGFFKDGAPVAGLSVRRPRQHPLEFGTNTLVEVANIPELETLSRKLLAGTRYTGLAEVEFMYDPKDERFEFVEINSRIWGFHSIAIRAGLDLPYLAYADALGIEATVGPVGEGVKWVRLVTDVPTALQEILAGALTLGQYLASVSGSTEFAVLSLSDPLPFIADVLLIPYYIKHRAGF